ncbi:MAG TPA: DUF5676 family membrane protein [Thermodesulfobacteriota bacterium]
MHTLNWKVMTWSLGSFAAVTYLVCILYGLVVPQALHMAEFLEIVLPGFRWLTPGAFVLGLVGSFLYGAYAGLVFTPLHNVFVRRFAAAKRG